VLTGHVAVIFMLVLTFSIGRHTSTRTIKAIFLDITGKKKPVLHGRATVAETAEAEATGEKKGVATPPEEAVTP
jgi:urea-proton symporter